MTLPSILLAFLVAFLYGALYHFVRNGGVGHLFMYLGLSVIGFGIGHVAAIWLGGDFLPVGQINLGTASVGSLVVLMLGDWLSRIEERPESKV